MNVETEVKIQNGSDDTFPASDRIFSSKGVEPSCTGAEVESDNPSSPEAGVVIDKQYYLPESQTELIEERGSRIKKGEGGEQKTVTYYGLTTGGRKKAEEYFEIIREKAGCETELDLLTRSNEFRQSEERFFQGLDKELSDRLQQDPDSKGVVEFLGLARRSVEGRLEGKKSYLERVQFAEQVRTTNSNWGRLIKDVEEKIHPRKSHKFVENFTSAWMISTISKASRVIDDMYEKGEIDMEQRSYLQSNYTEDLAGSIASYVEDANDIQIGEIRERGLKELTEKVLGGKRFESDIEERKDEILEKYGKRFGELEITYPDNLQRFPETSDEDPKETPSQGQRLKGKIKEWIGETQRKVRRTKGKVRKFLYDNRKEIKEAAFTWFILFAASATGTLLVEYIYHDNREFEPIGLRDTHTIVIESPLTSILEKAQGVERAQMYVPESLSVPEPVSTSEALVDAISEDSFIEQALVAEVDKEQSIEAVPEVVPKVISEVAASELPGGTIQPVETPSVLSVGTDRSAEEVSLYSVGADYLAEEDGRQESLTSERAIVEEVSMTEQPTQGHTYEIVRGDSLYKISKDAYGDGTLYPAIAQANGIENPQRIPVGLKVRVPTLEEVSRLIPERQKPVRGEYYTVVPGDNLWSIAERAYHDGSRWKEIYGANYGLDGTLIYSGMQLFIP
ncbi:LysM peptidoglycan-binding domain-containing protein [Candidatus Woesebacteria bacterium]|nr:LysM peptidoglycan-binding domain-containing protein [Candidatus Woesebacteria bacterium]